MPSLAVVCRAPSDGCLRLPVAGVDCKKRMEDGLAGKKRRIAELKASLAAKLSELEEALET